MAVQSTMKQRQAAKSHKLRRRTGPSPRHKQRKTSAARRADQGRRATPYQLYVYTLGFIKDPLPTQEQIRAYAHRVDERPERVHNWFSNARQKLARLKRSNDLPGTNKALIQQLRDIGIEYVASDTAPSGSATSGSRESSPAALIERVRDTDSSVVEGTLSLLYFAKRVSEVTAGPSGA